MVYKILKSLYTSRQFGKLQSLLHQRKQYFQDNFVNKAVINLPKQQGMKILELCMVMEVFCYC